MRCRWRADDFTLPAAARQQAPGHPMWRRLRDACPGDDLETAIDVLGNGRAAFHPVAAIDVADAEIVADAGVMDVAADHAVDGVALRFRNERALVFADDS